MNDEAGQAQGRDRARAARGVVSVVGAVFVAIDTVLVALIESFLVVLRVGTVRVPVSVAVALVMHPVLTWLMREVTGRRGSVFLPFVLWLAVVLPLSLARAEGDVIITGNNWVSGALLFGGAIAFAVTIGLLAPARSRPAGSLGADGSG